MTYYIVNPKAQPLSGFDVNDLTSKAQLKFRTKDIMSFPTEHEALEYLFYVIERCKQPNQAKKLKVSTFINW